MRSTSRGLSARTLEELRSVRALRATGLDRPSVAAQLGITTRRVRHLEEHYGLAAGETRFLTIGVCRDVRQQWALGASSKADLARNHRLTLDQVAAILSGADGTHPEVARAR